MIQIRLERYSADTQDLGECDCSITGCDMARGWTSAGLHCRFHSGRIFDPAHYSVSIHRTDPFQASCSRTVRWHMRQSCRARQSGQATVEYAITFAGIMMPLMFMIIFTAQLLWVWHSIVDYTRDGARYATTHCWQASGDNVMAYMRTHTPMMVDNDQFQNGQADISVQYFSRDPDTGLWWTSVAMANAAPIAFRMP